MLLWLAHCIGPFFLKCPERLSLKACRLSFLWSRLAEDKIVLGDISWQFGLSLFILRRFFLLGMGLGLCMKWAKAAEFFDLTTPVTYLFFLHIDHFCPYYLGIFFSFFIQPKNFHFLKHLLATYSYYSFKKELFILISIFSLYHFYYYCRGPTTSLSNTCSKNKLQINLFHSQTKKFHHTLRNFSDWIMQ